MDLLGDGSGVKAKNYRGRRNRNCCTLPKELIPHIGDQVQDVMDYVNS